MALRAASDLDERLRAVVNNVLAGRDAYGVLKLVVRTLLIRRLLTALQKAHYGEGVVKWLLSFLLPYVKRLPFVRAKLRAETEKVRKSIEPTLHKELTEPTHQLPPAAKSESDILALMEKRRELDTNHWVDGRVTGSIYHGEQRYMDFVGQVYGMFAFTNPLHASIHPATRQMESEVIQMVINLYNGDTRCCGAFTTGGTESILMACKAYRDRARAERGVSEPNIVCCVTAHAAFDKACQYFGIQMRHARTTESMQVDLRHVRRLVDSNTIALVGSSPQFAHGTIDPIEDLAQIATARGIGLHVDCCLGGFLIPFVERAGFALPHTVDFRVKGVTSISCDPHKYGFAPKGASIVMFSTHELRHHMYTYVTEWTGGIYATPSILGSRPGGIVAATWAALMSHGVEGYVRTTRQIVSATKRIGDAVRDIEGIELVGRTDVCVVAFGASKGSGLNVYSVADAMKDLGGWDLASCQHPPSVHLALTLPTSKNADQFVDDLQRAVRLVREDTTGKYKGGTAGIYGTAASLPASFVEESVKVYLDAYTKAATG